VKAEVRVADPDGAEAQACLKAYAAELDRRFATGYDPESGRPVPAGDLRAPAGVLLLATVGGEAVGCAGLRLLDGGHAEIKRMWVAEAARGHGIARRLLGELEARAAAAARHTVRLDTNGTLTEALALYRSAGYTEVERFNDEPYADHWFEKRITPAPA
jgi:ribosomal protein S18 acetylase RimI-like enzyme